MAGILSFLFFLFIVFFAFILPLLASIIKIVNQYERGIILRLGKFNKVVDPGLVILIPIVDRIILIDIREVPMNLPSQEVITADNITIKVSAVVYFQVVKPEDAFLKVQDYVSAIFQLAQTTLRNVVGQSELDEILQHREKINLKIKEIVDETTQKWGIKITLVEIKDIELPEAMQRAMAKQAEAERERRAKIIHAEGEYQAAQKLTEAANLMATQPVTIQLRLLQVLTEVSQNKGSVIVLPIPTSLMELISKIDKLNLKNPETNITIKEVNQ
jgi:regulator of protease activity HflC (stomatin/prohibitin superfamily)